MELLEKILMLGFGMIIFAFIFLIAIYVVLGIVLNKLNKKIYGKGTALAWIPFCNVYLLGKLTANKFVGIFLLFVLLITGEYNFSNGNNYVSFVIVPDNVRSIIMIIYSVFVVILFIYAIVKLNKLGNNEEATINEVYLNQKTKEELEQEDEVIELVKWDENATKDINPVYLNQTPNINNEKINETNISSETEILEEKTIDETKKTESNLPLEEEYDYNNPKIQEAIDNILKSSEENDNIL